MVRDSGIVLRDPRSPSADLSSSRMESCGPGATCEHHLLGVECHRWSNWGSTKIMATSDLIALKDFSCLDVVLNVLKHSSDPRDSSAKQQAIGLAPSVIEYFGETKSQQVYELLESALEDPAMGVRMEASTQLGQLGWVHAIAKLQSAIDKEQDLFVRDVMATEVSHLIQKKYQVVPKDGS